MPDPRDTRRILVPNVLQDKIARHRLHPRMPLYEIIEEAVMYWEEHGGWYPYTRAPVDPYDPLPALGVAQASRTGSRGGLEPVGPGTARLL